MSVLGGTVHDGHLAVAHRDVVLAAGPSAQDAVEAQFQSALGAAAGIVVEFADGAACQSAVRLEAEQHLVGVEAAAVHAFAEEGQLLAGPILYVCGQLRVDAPGVLAALLALQEAFAEPLLVAVGEDAGQAFGYAVQVDAESRIAEGYRLLFADGIRVRDCEVHVKGVLGHSAGENLTVAREDVATVSGNRGCLAVASHFLPVVALRRQHGVDGPSQDV